jgi:hypothetical protein
MDLFLCQRRHSDSDGNTPKSFCIYPAFCHCFGFSDELLLPAGFRCPRGWAATHREFIRIQTQIYSTHVMELSRLRCDYVQPTISQHPNAKSPSIIQGGTEKELFKAVTCHPIPNSAMLLTPAFLLLTRPQHSGNSPSPCPPGQGTETAFIPFQLLHHVSKPKANNALCTFPFLSPPSHYAVTKMQDLVPEMRG